MDEVIKIAMPVSVEMHVYPSSQGSGWVSHLAAVAPDVDSGEREWFGSRWRWESRPSRELLAVQVASWLDHEIQEQLGLRPHAALPVEQPHVAMPTFPSDHRNLTDVELDAMLARAQEPDAAGWRLRAALAELKARRIAEIRPRRRRALALVLAAGVATGVAAGGAAVLASSHCSRDAR